MNLSDWYDLNERAKKYGIDDHPALAQLLHIIQFKGAVVRGHKRTMNELNTWEKNIAKAVEQSIKAEEIAEREESRGDHQ